MKRLVDRKLRSRFKLRDAFRSTQGRTMNQSTRLCKSDRGSGQPENSPLSSTAGRLRHARALSLCLGLIVVTSTVGCSYQATCYDPICGGTFSSGFGHPDCVDNCDRRCSVAGFLKRVFCWDRCNDNCCNVACTTPACLPPGPCGPVSCAPACGVQGQVVSSYPMPAPQPFADPNCGCPTCAAPGVGTAYGAPAYGAPDYGHQFQAPPAAPIHGGYYDTTTPQTFYPPEVRSVEGGTQMQQGYQPTQVYSPAPAPAPAPAAAPAKAQPVPNPMPPGDMSSQFQNISPTNRYMPVQMPHSPYAQRPNIHQARY